MILSRRVGLAVSLAASLAAGGCTIGEGDPNKLEYAQLTLGSSQIVFIATNGKVQNAPLTIQRGATSTMIAEFRDGNDNADAEIHGGGYEVKIVSSNPGVVTFTRIGAFTGSVSGVSTGTADLAVSLTPLAGGKTSFGPFNVSITVN
jgi:hypothetical protein